MPKIPDRVGPVEDNINTAVDQTLPTTTVSTAPVFIASTSRLINLGNFENMSIGAAISIPMPQASDVTLADLERIVEETAAVAFGLISQETNSRYEMIKALRGRQKAAEETK